MSDLSVGVEALRRPIMPLIRYIIDKYLPPRPFEPAQLAEMPDEMEVDELIYTNVAEKLADYLEPLTRFYGPNADAARTCGRIVVDHHLSPIKPDLVWPYIFHQDVIRIELEKINTILCGQAGCVDCCVGPTDENNALFFELPLAEDEIDRFALPRVDSPATRGTSAMAETSLEFDGEPFYLRPAALYRWQDHWSLILPKKGPCPNLDSRVGLCRVYMHRPLVCRLPQIFPLVTEQVYDPEFVRTQAAAQSIPLDSLTDTDHVLIIQKGILGILDCPYVRKYSEEIYNYALKNGLDPLFRWDKK
ncbi:MAG: YkgJ family cysteine cluster protein [Deltaproteobacteria bacterium]|nr:YkgJ family cysteine cluster protein [Deltaproteobacteria bacterium]